MSWSDQAITKTNRFIKFTSGAPVELRIIDEAPVCDVLHGFGQEAVICLGAEECAACQDGEEPVEKFRTNVYHHGDRRVYIWEFGAGVMGQLKDIARSLEKKKASILEVDLEVTAKGEMKNRRYYVMPVFGTPLPLPTSLKKYELDRKSRGGGE